MNFSSRTRQRRVASISMRARGEAWPQGGGMARGGAPLACLFLCLFLPGKARGRGRDRGGGREPRSAFPPRLYLTVFAGRVPKVNTCHLASRCAAPRRRAATISGPSRHVPSRPSRPSGPASTAVSFPVLPRSSTVNVAHVD